MYSYKTSWAAPRHTLFRLRLLETDRSPGVGRLLLRATGRRPAETLAGNTAGGIFPGKVGFFRCVLPTSVAAGADEVVLVRTDARSAAADAPTRRRNENDALSAIEGEFLRN